MGQSQPWCCWFLGSCHWVKCSLVARSTKELNLQRMAKSDTQWLHSGWVGTSDLCVVISKTCIHLSYTNGRTCPHDIHLWKLVDTLRIKSSNILHKHTRTYPYKRRVLSQARSFIDPRKMPESTLTVVAQWNCRVNINQQERLIDWSPATLLSFSPPPHHALLPRPTFPPCSLCGLVQT